MKFRNSVPYKEIMDFVSKRKISINLFFYNQENESLEVSEKRYKTLRMFGLKASLGSGSWSNDKEFDEVVMDRRLFKVLWQRKCWRDVSC